MATKTAAAFRRAFRQVAGNVPPDLSDRELLHRFAAEDDQAAFAALVGRHAGMVLGVCRRALSHQQDAEDACQATFLLLARKARGQRWQASVANWLYASARKVAHNARVSAERRAKRERRAAVPESGRHVDRMSARELLTTLDEEMDRLPPAYREALVLCYLEGLSSDEAAARLGVPSATFRTRVTRGRKRLHEALTKSGCALGAGLLALAVTSPAEASSPRFLQAIVRTASGTVPEGVAELVKGVAVNEIVRKSLMALAGLTAVVVLGVGLNWTSFSAAGALPRQPQSPAEQRPARADKEPAEVKDVVVAGVVRGPDDKPVAGAVLALGEGRKEKLVVTDLGKSDAEGHFRFTLPAGSQGTRSLVARANGLAADWVNLKPGSKGESDLVLKLCKAEVPVRGRVLTLEGQPVPKAVVLVNRIYAPDAKVTLKQVYETWPGDPDRGAHLMQKHLGYPTAAGLPEEVTTDAEGRFEIKGVGDGRMLMLQFKADAIEHVYVRVAVDAAFDAKAVVTDPAKAEPGRPSRIGPPLYGPTFDHTGRPCRPVVGTVTDHRTGKPLENVVISGHLPPGQGWWENSAHAKTDASGKYRLRGLPNANSLLSFAQVEDTPYLMLMKSVEPTAGLEPATCDMTMIRGVNVTGRVIDKATGKPIKGGIQYAPLMGNKELAGLPGEDVHVHGGMSHSLDAEGRFRFVAPPGPGIIIAQAELRDGDQKPYAQARIKDEDRARDFVRSREGLGDSFITASGIFLPLLGWHAYQVIEPKAGDDAVKVDLTLDPGKSVEGKVIGPDGQPLAGATVAGLSPSWETPAVLSGATFTAHALAEGEKRSVAAIHAEKKLGGLGSVSLDDKEAPTIKLGPWGAITGRLLHEGKPVAGAEVRVSYNSRAAQRLFSYDQRVVTDKDGRFRVDVPFDDLRLYLGLSHKGKRLSGRPEVHQLTVAAGATKELGDVAVTPED